MPSVQGGQSLEQLLQDPELKKLPAFLSWYDLAWAGAPAWLISLWNLGAGRKVGAFQVGDGVRGVAMGTGGFWLSSYWTWLT